ncbi:hypothetical protein FA13DRAFT_1725287 [Coprinellus micaceus]|uniref:Uncharacterized protein n=1 Tax=Coprinellus micaceus TaxID=71717 RepID=A0A4Y7U0I6_COPMI|nr:hypothetical protein FA13DRAFT_1725287 [Coprinellus micaceus]
MALGGPSKVWVITVGFGRELRFGGPTGLWVMADYGFSQVWVRTGLTVPITRSIIRPSPIFAVPANVAHNPCTVAPIRSRPCILHGHG